MSEAAWPFSDMGISILEFLYPHRAVLLADCSCHCRRQGVFGKMGTIYERAMAEFAYGVSVRAASVTPTDDLSSQNDSHEASGASEDMEGTNA